MLIIIISQRSCKISGLSQSSVKVKRSGRVSVARVFYSELNDVPYSSWFSGFSFVWTLWNMVAWSLTEVFLEVLFALFELFGEWLIVVGSSSSHPSHLVLLPYWSYLRLSSSCWSSQLDLGDFLILTSLSSLLRYLENLLAWILL